MQVSKTQNRRVPKICANPTVLARILLARILLALILVVISRRSHDDENGFEGFEGVRDI